MIPELEKPKILEIKVRMDCNGCVQKLKKALHGINGIYDVYIDFPQQKLTIIGWADPEKIMKAIKKTRKIATICSESEQTDSQAVAAHPGDNPMPTGGETAYMPSMEAPPSHEVAMVGVAGMPGQSYTEVTHGHAVVHDAQNSQPYDPTNPNGQHAQPVGSYEVGQVHTTYSQPHEQGHIVHHGSSEPVHHVGAEPGHVVSHQPEHSHVVHQHQPEHGHVGYQQSPMHGHVVHQQSEHGHVVGHHQPTDHGHVVHQQPQEHSYGHVVHHQPTEHSHGQVVHHQPTEHSHGQVVHHQPTEHSYGQVVHHQPVEYGHVPQHQHTEHSHGHVAQPHQFEHSHGHTSSYNYHNNSPGAVYGSTSMPQPTVIHSYNTYQPSPYVTEYIRPLTSHRPSPYTYEYIPQQPTTYYSPRMDRYNEDYYNTGTSSNNGNITSIFSDENPNACNLM